MRNTRIREHLAENALDSRKLLHRDFANLNEKSSIEQGHGVSRGVLQILHMVDSATFIAGDAHTVVPCPDDLQGTSKVFCPDYFCRG